MRGGSRRQSQQAKAKTGKAKTGKAEPNNSLHVILPGRQSFTQRRPVSTLPNAARTKVPALFDLLVPRANSPGFKVNALQDGFTLTSYCAVVAMHP
jgi:hypothetical protein